MDIVIYCIVTSLYFIFLLLGKRERIEFAITAIKYDRRFKVGVRD